LKGPLDGVRVVEIGTAIAGPLCAALLGDMGADVVKVELPRRGDDSRMWGEQVQGESPYFIQYNRNKRSLALDLKGEEGKKILTKLLRGADVLVENFRAGTMAKLGFSYGRLSRINPRLVYCSISGFGQKGPYSSLGGYDAIVQAMSGLMAVTGEADGPPLRVGIPITDIIAALHAAYSVVLALFARGKTGKGQMIDVSLFESGVSAVAQWATISAMTGKAVGRFGNEYPLLSPYEVFDAQDRPIVVAVGNDQLWAKLCQLLGMEGLIDDPRFRSNPDRIKPENRRLLHDILAAAFAKRDASAWISLLWGEGIPAGMIKKVEELWEDPQLRHRGAFTKVKHSKLGPVHIVSTIPKLSMTPGKIRRASPTLGEHSEEILTELGYSKKQIQALRDKGVL
jgi:formyl-CoA transferase/CoA:oxalate CoA-transferase